MLKMKRPAGLGFAIIAALLTFIVAQAGVGSLDPTFGTGGKVVTDVGSSNSAGSAVAVPSDGKILVAGYTQIDPGNPNATELALVRYNSTGSLDTSFGTNGIVTASGIDRGLDVALQADGKILVAGDKDFAVARFNSDGTPDSTFGTDGIVTKTFSEASAFGHSIALQADGKILAAGYINIGTHPDFALARYNSDGSADISFGSNGMVNTDLSSGTGQSDDYGFAVAVQTDGRIVVAGNTQDATGTRLAFARYNTDGSLDPSFGTGGKLVSNFGSTQIYGYSAALQKDGKIVAVGDNGSGNNSGDKFAVARFNTNGSADTTFGANGLTLTSLGDTADYSYDLAVQSDGKLVVAGDSFNAGQYHFALARYNTNGSLDTTFGAAGKIGTAFGSYDDHAKAVVLQPDGRIVLAGSTSDGTNTGVALARYYGVLPVTFVSQASNDGWVLESTETSGVGGTQNSNATTLNVGDDAKNRQYRGILSFNTASIPDTAVITSALLKIRQQGVVGTDPFSTHGDLLADLRNGHFGSSLGLELADFSSAASTGSATEHLSALGSSWYGVVLSPVNLAYISKIGVTQFRLRFTLDDDNNSIADYVKFYSGNAASGSQPQLIVTYYVP